MRGTLSTSYLRVLGCSHGDLTLSGNDVLWMTMKSFTPLLRNKWHVTSWSVFETIIYKWKKVKNQIKKRWALSYWCVLSMVLSPQIQPPVMAEHNVMATTYSYVDLRLNGNLSISLSIKACSSTTFSIMSFMINGLALSESKRVLEFLNYFQILLLHREKVDQTAFVHSFWRFLKQNSL